MSQLRGLAIGTLVVGAGIALMSYLPVWATYLGGGNNSVHVGGEYTGRQLVPLAFALGLAVLAGAVAVWAVRGVWVRVVGVLLLLCTAYLVWAPISFHARPVELVAIAVASQSGGMAIISTDAVVVHWWWLPALVGGVVAFVGALLVVVHRGRWGGFSDRYERGSTPTGPSKPRTGATTWDALDRGDDPTLTDSGEPPA